MFYKILAAIFVVIALSLALTMSVWHQQALPYILFVSRFFDIMLPVLAVGALLKYLCCHGHCACKKHECCEKKD